MRRRPSPWARRCTPPSPRPASGTPTARTATTCRRRKRAAVDRRQGGEEANNADDDGDRNRSRKRQGRWHQAQDAKHQCNRKRHVQSLWWLQPLNGCTRRREAPHPVDEADLKGGRGAESGLHIERRARRHRKADGGVERHENHIHENHRRAVHCGEGAAECLGRDVEADRQRAESRGAVRRPGPQRRARRPRTRLGIWYATGQIYTISVRWNLESCNGSC